MAINLQKDPCVYWTKVAQNRLQGRTIQKVGYLTNEEANQLGWTDRSVVLELDNGTLILVQSDDEGNNAGSLQVVPKEGSTDAYTILPVLTNDQYSFDLDSLD